MIDLSEEKMNWLTKIQYIYLLGVLLFWIQLAASEFDSYRNTRDNPYYTLLDTFKTSIIWPIGVGYSMFLIIRTLYRHLKEKLIWHTAQCQADLKQLEIHIIWLWVIFTIY